MLPGDPGVQHEQNPLHHLPVGQALAAWIAKRRSRFGKSGSTNSQSSSKTIHGTAAIGTPPSLTTDAGGSSPCAGLSWADVAGWWPAASLTPYQSRAVVVLLFAQALIAELARCWLRAAAVVVARWPVRAVCAVMPRVGPLSPSPCRAHAAPFSRLKRISLVLPTPKHALSPPKGYLPSRYRTLWPAAEFRTTAGLPGGCGPPRH